jgi:hypothetical protein
MRLIKKEITYFRLYHEINNENIIVTKLNPQAKK